MNVKYCIMVRNVDSFLHNINRLTTQWWMFPSLYRRFLFGAILQFDQCSSNILNSQQSSYGTGKKLH